jgi:uncharacterized DUF497 family protein
MPWLEVMWIEGPAGNVQHIAQHGITTQEVEDALSNPVDTDRSESSGRPIVFGYTAAGRFLAVVYEPIDQITVYPITAFDVEQ